MRNLIKLSIIFVLLMGYVFAAFAQEPMASVRLINGTMQIKRVNSDKWEIATVGMMIFPGDQLKTGQNSKAFILFTDASQIKMNASSLLTIEGKKEGKNVSKKLKLSVGEIWGKVTRQDSPMQIETPTSVASVKGTEFDMALIEENGQMVTWLFVFEGAMELMNELGQLLVVPGIQGSVGEDTPPEGIPVNENQLPNWQNQIEPQWNLLIEPASDTNLIEQQFSIHIKATNMSDGQIATDYNKTVALSANSPTMTFSVDGGQTWSPSLTFTLTNGEKTIMAKDTQTGTPLLGIAAENTSPGFAVLSIVAESQENPVKTMEINILDEEGNLKKVIIKYTD